MAESLDLVRQSHSGLKVAAPGQERTVTGVNPVTSTGSVVRTSALVSPGALSPPSAGPAGSFDAPSVPAVSRSALAPRIASETDAEAGAEPAVTPSAPAIPRARGMRGERTVARILRVGAMLSGGMFAASLLLELLPVSETTSVIIDHLQKAAASLLLVTPVARLAAAGMLLGRRGEWRYTVYAACVLAMLAIAVGAGIAA